MNININTHDLNLPAWGPYSKKYGGISHVADPSSGLRFDLAIMPGYYRRQMIVPNEKWASGQHAWEASSDLSYYSYRYEIEWKDQVYCDVSFTSISDSARLIRSNFVNNTERPQDLMTHLVASMNFPPVRPYCDEWIELVEVEVPSSGVWVDALDYHQLSYKHARPSDGLVEDGMYRAEIRDHGLTNGNGIGCGFAKDKGDLVSYNVNLDKPISNAKLVLRCRIKENVNTSIKLKGVIETSFKLENENSSPDSFGFSIFTLDIGNVEKGEHQLFFVSEDTVRLELDGFGIVPLDSELKFKRKDWQFVPEIYEGPSKNSLILKYKDSDCYYGIAWDHPNPWLRQLYNNELDSFMREIVPDHMSPIKHGKGKGHFMDVFLRPISLLPQSSQQTFALVCSGNHKEVISQIETFFEKQQLQHENHHAIAKKNNIDFSSSSRGKAYHFSQQKMAATEMLNVVYPVYTRRQFIKHNTPGKWWDCLYTWDSGFIGLALLELDKQRAIENLNAYVTPEGDQHAAFIHHGSPVPTQMYLFLEIWNQTQDQEMLDYFYASLRQYYQYLAGHINGSTTRQLGSNLLRTWEYFFDSGGWDDYPAQLHTLENENPDQIACSSITAHIIRCAKILKATAIQLNKNQDILEYDSDIKMFTSALQEHAWDAESGYFSYVTHDAQGKPTGHLMHQKKTNFNMGLDGVMPLFAGSCNEAQRKILLSRLKDPKHFWTNIGLSTVDQSAPYYRKDGYWNGAVWMPQQWFIWKTALDMGDGEFAFNIASTALNLWKKEVENSYYCFEHFLIASERGTGWHQFGGLSSPVLAWFNAYYKVGRLTVGMDVWIEKQNFSENNSKFSGILRVSEDQDMAIVINLRDGHDYEFSCNGKPIRYKQLESGSYNLVIPFVSGINELIVKPKD